MRKLKREPFSRRFPRFRFGKRNWVASTYRTTWKEFGSHISSSDSWARSYRIAGKRLYKRVLRKYYRQIAKQIQTGTSEKPPPASLARYLTQLHETW
jgi:hypothetical protein